MADQSVGFIGFGNMGGPMALNLCRAGHRVHVFARNRERLQPCAELGAIVVDSAAELARRSDIVFLCLTDTAAVRNVVFGESGVAEGARSDSILIDHSTISPDEAENAAALLDEYLRIRFDASHAIFIATANDVTVLPGFILDRFLVIPVAAPTDDALLAVTRQIAAKIIPPLGLPMPDEAVLGILARRNPRRIGRVLRLALGFAAAEGRKTLAPADVVAADALASSEETPAPIGFMRPGKAPENDRE